MAKPPALKALQQRLKTVVRGQTEKTNREILTEHVLKWRELQKPLQVMDDADKRVPGWAFRVMFEETLLAEIGGKQRAQGRMAMGKNQKYVRIAKAIQNGESVVGTKLSDLKQARAYTAEYLDAYREKLYRIDMIIAVAEERAVEVINDEVIEEADRRIAQERGA